MKEKGFPPYSLKRLQNVHTSVYISFHNLKLINLNLMALKDFGK